MWQLEYTPEAQSYALDSYPYNEAVLMAIDALGLTEEGIPTENCVAWEEDCYLWEVAEHLVSLRVIWPKLQILWIKPME